MAEKIDIVEILKDKPQGTILYDYLHNIDVEFDNVETTEIETSIWCTRDKGGYNELFGYSKLGTLRGWLDGLQILLPSKEMRDWSKFAWKKGDILVNNDAEVHIIFDRFEDDAYKNFHGQYYLWEEGGSMVSFEEGENYMQTSDFNKANKEDAQEYIHKIEKELGGKLNMETLEIEKPQSEFKDGDIVALVVRKCTHIAIFQSRQEAYIGFHAVLCQNDELLLEEPFREDVGDIELRLATDSEKQQLFDALEKEGKAWDAEKKQIVDLKPKCEFKPFDKVLCRNSKDDTWEADFFARLTRKEIDYTQSGKYLCVGDLWMYCIPYNKETAHLLGTTDEWKGGEG